MKVRIKDWGERYTTYDKWFEENNCEEYLDNYHEKSALIYDTYCIGDTWCPVDKKGHILDTHNMVFEVIKEGKHREFKERTLYLIKEPISNKVHLINKKGVEEVK